VLTAPFQMRAGHGVPGDFDFLSGDEAADFRFVDEAAHQHLREIAFLQQEVSDLHVGPLLDGQRVDDAVKRRAHAGFAERVCGSFVGGLGFGALSVNFCGLGLGVAVFLLLLEQSGVRLARCRLLRPAGLPRQRLRPVAAGGETRRDCAGRP